MKVFKFGGASVKDADSVKNVVKILDRFPGEKLAIVISAMGKTTNALEEMVRALWQQDNEMFAKKLEDVKQYHAAIVEDLFGNKSAEKIKLLDETFAMMKHRFLSADRKEFDYEYDQMVSMGEILSTQIVSEYLKELNKSVQWMDARKLIRTNHAYREAEVNWKMTEELILMNMSKVFETTDWVITQGFIGHTSDGHTTTLGREGSDFTAGILAFCLQAQDVTIWKDVDGMLNADPRIFENTVKLDRISFKEAIELSYYGASVIHPKTVKPLQNKGIPLFVKSFVHPEKEGTIIQHASDQDHLIPSFIVKKHQILLSFTPRDFSFIVEENLSDIFNRLARINAKINLMQNSALSFSVLLDEEKTNLDQLLGVFENTYSVKFNQNLELVTIRHYDQKTIDFVCAKKQVIVEQRTRETARFVLKG